MWKFSFLVFAFVASVFSVELGSREEQGLIIQLVQHWSSQIGEKLTDLSTTMTRYEEFERNFSALDNKLIKEDPNALVARISGKISTMMETKSRAVRNISEYAEYLSYHRKDENLTAESSYYYFNADNISSDEVTPMRTKEIADDILTLECHWFNEQRNLDRLPDNLFSDQRYRISLFQPRGPDESGVSGDDCAAIPNNTRKSYEHLPMVYDERFGDSVNLNLSIAKIATNVYERETKVLEGVKWTEPLDLVFKMNRLNDSTLTWQYFASPHGFMRHYPAIKWSQEQYDRTYDFRTRPWYTEAISSPKDIVILLDRSGSMTGTRRAMSVQIVNQILDTLNDNDFVNIYTFTNTTEPLVNCFNDTLFQANEENLRLLREALPTYIEVYAANLSLGMHKAFDILKNIREKRTSAKCNQAIMLITEGVDYEYDKTIFNQSNWLRDFPVRVFAYQIGDDETDARELEWIACANMGYWANMTDMGDIREKMLHYLTVMSRPINYNLSGKRSRPFIWSYLHVDLADRRLSNWLWKKFEGIRQRQVFLDHQKRIVTREGRFFGSENHMLLQTDEYEQYINKWRYKYMTTVSLPVYGRREDEFELIGVAGVDVPIELFRACIPFARLGVNGYAFIVTNNGYILMHPDHNTEFEDILKPTFNRVDVLEVEILDDDREPRLFGDEVVKLREKLVEQNTENLPHVLRVKYPLDDMKRVILATRHYYLAAIGPFTLGVVLPDNYGFVKAQDVEPERAPAQTIRGSSGGKWGVHPDWVYCERCSGSTNKEKVIDACRIGETTPLLGSLLWDMEKTTGFYDDITTEYRYTTLQETYQVHKVFLSTRTGLTRWTDLDETKEDEVDGFERGNNRSIEEGWYRRAVEINFKDPVLFVYSVPFEISGYENNTMITSTRTIFAGKRDTVTPVAVVGMQFNHRAMSKIYASITTKVNRLYPSTTCKVNRLNCYILDNNAYVVLSDEPEYIGRYIGDIRADTMSYLISDGVYRATRMFDYQAICQKMPPKPQSAREKLQHKKEKINTKSAAAPIVGKILNHFSTLTGWFSTIMFNLFNFFDVVRAEDIYLSAKPEMLAWNKLEIPKTVPTPCDHEMWLFNLNENLRYPFSPFREVNNTKFYCQWHYIVDKIPGTNLIFLATNDLGPCRQGAKDVHSTEPKEIRYNITEESQNSLPCYIAVKNNYTRRMYMRCDNRSSQENELYNGSRYHCGHYWD